MVDKMDQLGIFHNEEIKPLAYRARPTKLEDFVGQTFSIRIIQKMIEKNKINIEEAKKILGDLRNGSHC